MAKKTTKKKLRQRKSETVHSIQRPPVFESSQARKFYERLRDSSVAELAVWQENGAETDFAQTPVCEAAVLNVSLFAKLRLWDDVCRVGEALLAEVDCILAEMETSARRMRCRANTGYVAEILGQGYAQLENYQRAALCFETAIELNPYGQNSYLHWAELAQRLGMRELAGRIITAGLKRIPSSPELRIYQQAVTNRPTVSVCMIVRDEEEFLEGCLLSVRDIADEIILVDTGSTDRTVEIAETFGCRIFHQPWEGDFSRHRNHSLEQATADWIFVIDADERLIEKDVPHLRECLQKTEFDLLSLTVYNLAERSGRDTTFLPSVRIFRRELGLRYEGIVHNRLNYTADMKELRCPVGLRHYGYDLTPEKMKRKHERSLELLRKQLEEDADNAFAHFNLAQLVRARGNLERESDCREVILHATRVIELTEPSSLQFGSIHLMAHHQLATAYYALADYRQAAEACLRALEIDNTYLDCVITLAHIYRLQGRFTEARERYTRYLELQRDYSEHQQTNTLIIIHLNSRTNAHYNLGIIAEAEQNYVEALEQYQLALAEERDYLDANNRAGWMCYRLAKHTAAQQHFRREIEIHPDRESAYLGLAETLADAGDFAAAEATLRNGLETADSATDILCRYSDLLVDTSRANEALELLAGHQSALAESAEFLAARGRAELTLGLTEAALESFRVSDKLSPGNVLVAAGLADANLILENNVEACENYQRALAQDPCSAHLLRNHAIALARTGRLSEAVERLAEYIPIAPDDRESRFVLGALLLQLQRSGEALRVYETLLREEPSDAEALLALSDCYLSLGGLQAAEVGYQRLLSDNPNHTLAKERLSALQAKQSQLAT